MACRYRDVSSRTRRRGTKSCRSAQAPPLPLHPATPEDARHRPSPSARVTARYHPGRILITDDAVAGRRVSGVVDGRDPDRALRAIVGTLPVRLQSFGPYLTLLHRA